MTALTCRTTAMNGYLWYARGSLFGFTHNQAQSSAQGVPGIAVTSGSLSFARDLALDCAGNVWAVSRGDSRVFRFPASAVEASGGATPDLVISSAALQDPENLTFDSNGNLWVADRRGTTAAPDADGILMRFDGVQTMSGTQDLTPALQISSSAPVGPLFVLGNIAFDGSGNLWATSMSGIVRFNDPRSMTGTLTLTPDALVQKAPDVAFYGLAFDSSGALWVATAIGLQLSSVEKFAHPASFTGAVTPTPDVTIAGPSGGLPGGDVTFDADGNLWQLTSGAVLEYTSPGSLSGSVNPTPAVALEITDTSMIPLPSSHLVLFPTPAGLPEY